jgi:hypothetical protein
MRVRSSLFPDQDNQDTHLPTWNPPYSLISHSVTPITISGAVTLPFPNCHIKNFQRTFHKAIIHLSTRTHCTPGYPYYRCLSSHYIQLFNIQFTISCASSRLHTSSNCRRSLAFFGKHEATCRAQCGSSTKVKEATRPAVQNVGYTQLNILTALSQET